MDTNLQPTKPLALEPIESAPDDGAPPARQLRITIADEFVAAAAKEYQDGHVDQALWSRASQAGADEALVVAAYLRARATALRMERRKKPTDAAVPDAPSAGPVSQPPSEVRPRDAAVAPRWAKRRMLAVAAALAVAGVVALALMIAAQRHVDSPGAPVAPKLSSGNPTQASAVPAAAPSAAGNSTPGAGRSEDAPTLETKVRQLKDAGNWNVLVLYASEWTRKDPGSAAAWSDLALGYANLRQFDDALPAAARAVQLAPSDALLWRNLAQVNLAIDRLPDAATAFDNAVLANPGDVVALCGASAVAQKQGRLKDADTFAARARSLDARCPAEGNADKEPAVHPAARKPQPIAAR